MGFQLRSLHFLTPEMMKLFQRGLFYFYDTCWYMWTRIIRKGQCICVQALSLKWVFCPVPFLTFSCFFSLYVSYSILTLPLSPPVLWAWRCWYDESSLFLVGFSDRCSLIHPAEVGQSAEFICTLIYSTAPLSFFSQCSSSRQTLSCLITLALFLVPP